MRPLSILLLTTSMALAETDYSPDRPDRLSEKTGTLPMATMPMGTALNDEQIVAELYGVLLARKPSTLERVAAISFLRSYGADRKSATRDLVWALSNNYSSDRSN